MQLKKSIKFGKIKNRLYLKILIFFLVSYSSLSYSDDLEGNYTYIKVLDKISSKNILIKLENGKDEKHKDLVIKSIKCKNSEFDDNPEITAYIQVKDLINNNKDDVFVFNGWMFSSSRSITPFDPPGYVIRLFFRYLSNLH